MPIEIHLDTHITPAQQQHLFGWGDDIYEDACYNLRWRPRRWRLLLYADGHLASHVGMVTQTVLVEQQPVRVGGVGQVVTVPEAQRQGLAQRALAHAANFLCHNLAVQFGLLFCIERMLPFYAQLGWQQVEAPVWIEQPAGKVRCPMPVMVLPCRGQQWPPGAVDLHSLPW